MSKKHTGATPAQLQAGFNKIKTQLPAKIANKARNFFTQSWARQGFLGSNGLEAWPARKNNTGKQGRALLVQTGALRRSLFASHTIDTATVRVQGPAKRYAGVHNAGGTINNKGGQPYLVLPADKVSTATRRRMPRRGDKVIVFLKKNRAAFPKGTKFTKPFSFKMPKRQFIGNSNVLNRQLLVMVHRDIRKVINNQPL